MQRPLLCEPAEVRSLPPLPGGSLFCGFGELIQDQIVRLAGPLQRSGQVDGRVFFEDGGCAANVMWAAVAGGGRARFLGHVGIDPTGSWLVSELERVGIEVMGPRRGSTATSICIVDVTGEPSFVFDPGDSRSMAPSDFDIDSLANCRALYLSSHHLYAPETRSAFLRIAELAQHQNIPIALDTAAANRLQEFGIAEYLELLADIQPTVLFANEGEAAVLKLGPLVPRGLDFVVVHRGSKPTLIYDHASVCEVPVREVTRVVDATGAGDGFAGGFLQAWSQTDNIETAVQLAHHSARQVVTLAGARVPVLGTQDASLTLPARGQLQT